MLQQSSAAITGLSTLSTSAFAKSEVVTDVEGSVDDYVIPYDLSLHNNGTQKHKVNIKIGKNEFGDTVVAESYTLQGLNAPSGVKPDDAVFKAELPISGEGLHVVKATLDGGQSDSEQIRLNGGIPDESAVVVRIDPDNTVTLDTIIE